LTTTAAGYFPKAGFSAISREQAQPEIRTSLEFAHACPASAIVMRLPLDRL
jgi:N-acetylglutamate synthase-like GNAT family acetyltransferase